MLTMLGCTPEINLGPRKESETIHERLGQPSTIAQSTPIKVTTTNAKGESVTSKMRADGMKVIDRPTYELYHEAWKEKKEREAAEKAEKK